jgi:hypothetical protein
MARTYKEAQVQGTSSTSTYATLYSTPTGTVANISTIAICNTASASATYRVAIMESAGTPSAQNWLIYDSVVAANDTVFITIGVSLSSQKFVRVSSSANTVSFSAFVSETS